MIWPWIIKVFSFQPDPAERILSAYRATFLTPTGETVLRHLIDEVYSAPCYSKDPIEIASHNARRSVVHEILQNVYQRELHRHQQE